MWKLLEHEMPRENRLVLFRWYGNEGIAAGYWIPHSTSQPVFIIGGNGSDGDDPISWCEIPE